MSPRVPGAGTEDQRIRELAVRVAAARDLSVHEVEDAIRRAAGYSESAGLESVDASFQLAQHGEHVEQEGGPVQDGLPGIGDLSTEEKLVSIRQLLVKLLDHYFGRVRGGVGHGSSSHPGDGDPNLEVPASGGQGPA